LPTAGAVALPSGQLNSRRKIITTFYAFGHLSILLFVIAAIYSSHVIASAAWQSILLVIASVAWQSILLVIASVAWQSILLVIASVAWQSILLVIASAAKQSSECTFSFSGLLRRFAPRNDGGIAIVCIVETELKLSDALIFPDEKYNVKITNFRLKLR